MTGMTSSECVVSASSLRAGYASKAKVISYDGRLGQAQRGQTAATSLCDCRLPVLLLTHKRSRLIFLVSSRRCACMHLVQLAWKLRRCLGRPPCLLAREYRGVLACQTGRHVEDGMRINCQCVLRSQSRARRRVAGSSRGAACSPGRSSSATRKAPSPRSPTATAAASASVTRSDESCPPGAYHTHTCPGRHVMISGQAQVMRKLAEEAGRSGFDYELAAAMTSSQVCESLHRKRSSVPHVVRPSVFCRVNGDMATALVRQVAVGASFTVAITVDGKVYQMGATGATGRAKWEGAKAPELVRMLVFTRAGPGLLRNDCCSANACLPACRQQLRP